MGECGELNNAHRLTTPDESLMVAMIKFPMVVHNKILQGAHYLRRRIRATSGVVFA